MAAHMQRVHHLVAESDVTMNTGSLVRLVGVT